MFISIDRCMSININRQMKKLFGLVLIITVLAWDADAIRPHLAAHSWVTLGYVLLTICGWVLADLTIIAFFMGANRNSR
jgi:hypothetical protein